MNPWSPRKNAGIFVLALLTIAMIYSCAKTNDAFNHAPVISYQQKIISIPVDQQMIPVRPDSTGGPINKYFTLPELPKGISINEATGVISGKASDTLSPTRFIVTATGPGGRSSDTLTIAIGTVGFTYGNNGAFTFEKNSTELTVTPISPTIIAGSFSQFFLSPSQDNLLSRTGLTFNSQTGQISGAPTQLTSTTEVPTPLTYTVTGISTGNKAASTTINITINDKKPIFTYTFGGSYTVGTAIGNTLSPTKLTGSGAIVKYRVAPGSAALPTGLTLDSLSGNITGTPSAAADVTVAIRALNTGGYQDANVHLVVNATAVAPQVRYMMSLASGNVIDTLAPALYSGSTLYLTKLPDNYGGVFIYLNPVLTTGQAGATSTAYTNNPAFTTGTANEAITLTGSSGIISGTPGQFTTSSTPAHTLTIANAASGGPAGSFAMNIVANAAYFTYNADGGKGVGNPNAYLLVQGQQLGVANGTYPGYTAAGLAPVGGSGVINYTVYPSSASTPAFSTTGLTINATTGAISGVPATNTNNFGNYAFYDYIVKGQKADGSFTLYKIRFKIYKTVSEWGS